MIKLPILFYFFNLNEVRKWHGEFGGIYAIVQHTYSLSIINNPSFKALTTTLFCCYSDIWKNRKGGVRLLVGCRGSGEWNDSQK